MNQKKKSGPFMFILESVVFLALFFVLNRAATAFMQPGREIQPKLDYLQEHFVGFSTDSRTLLTAGLLALLAILLLFHNKDNKKYRDGEEYGSAEWSDPAAIAPYMSENPRENIILTNTEGLRLTGRAKKPEQNRNANVLVTGGSGTGKTRFYMKPNILQAFGTYIITDPKGTLLEDCGLFLSKRGYDVKVLNLKDSYSIRNLSMHYNPFYYVNSEFDIISLAETLMKNTTDQKAQAGDPFWQKAETLMYMAFIGYIYYQCPPKERNFSTLYHMVTKSRVNEMAPNEQNPIDVTFSELREEKENLDLFIQRYEELSEAGVQGLDAQKFEKIQTKKDNLNFCIEQYAAFKLAPPKTALSILISAAARLAPFTIGEIKKLTASDDMQLSELGERKIALFLITSDSNPVLNFLIGILYTQLFNQLMTRADNEHHGVLPVPVRCMLDEFANIGQIPNFKEIIAVIRSRNISANVVLQAASDLEAIYKEKAPGIIANCDSNLFLGTGDDKEAEKISKALGKGTIDTRTTGESTSGKSQKGSSKNFQRKGRELKTPDEITTLKGNKCILRIRGERPFLSDKYKLERHPNYKYLSDANPDNRFDVAKYIEAFNRREEKRKEVERQRRASHRAQSKGEAIYMWLQQDMIILQETKDF